MRIESTDPRLTWQGAISFEQSADGLVPWRIPFDQKEIYAPVQGLRFRSNMASGVRIAFHSDTTSLGCDYVAEEEPEAIHAIQMDVLCDGEHVQTLDLKGNTHVSLSGLPASDKRIELWLPQTCRIAVSALTIDDQAQIRPYEDNRRKWVTYGSSISHCMLAESPSQTWPAIVAREHDLNLTSLGYGGQCHLDPMIAMMIRELPADLITMKVGINIQGAGSLSPRSFRPAIIGFVRILREKHPTTPIGVISPIYAFDRDTEKNAVGFNITDMRAEVEDAVLRLQAAGDDRIRYFDGLSLFGPDFGHLMPDNLHPNAQGYKELGHRIAEVVMPELLQMSDSR